VLRDDHLHALRALSRDAHATPLIKVFDRAQAWAHEVDWSSIEAARQDLEAANALMTSAEADDLGVILRLPSDVARPASADPVPMASTIRCRSGRSEVRRRRWRCSVT
jgi:hypothetical protein